jgi:hypothetical protein
LTLDTNHRCAAKTRPPKPVVLDANTLANAVNLERNLTVEKKIWKGFRTLNFGIFVPLFIITLW